MISFSRQVKEELLRQEIYNEKLFLSTVIMSSSIVDFTSTGVEVNIKSSNISLIRKILKILKDNYPQVEEQIIIRENKQFKRNNKQYIVKITKGSKHILKDLGLVDDINGIFIEFHIPKSVFKNEKSKKEFVKCLFITSGSINNPKIQKQYHLEILFNNESLLEEVKGILLKFGIKFKKTKRKNIVALYLNKGEEIADFLKLVGSIECMFDFENQRLLRDIRVVENRLMNAELANEIKQQSSSDKQIYAINQLKEKKIFDSLKERTKLIAEVRMQNQDASLNEMVELLGNKISKSNIRHHLNILIKEVEKINE